MTADTICWTAALLVCLNFCHHVATLCTRSVSVYEPVSGSEHSLHCHCVTLSLKTVWSQYCNRAVCRRTGSMTEYDSCLSAFLLQNRMLVSTTTCCHRVCLCVCWGVQPMPCTQKVHTQTRVKAHWQHEYMFNLCAPAAVSDHSTAAVIIFKKKSSKCGVCIQLCSTLLHSAYPRAFIFVDIRRDTNKNSDIMIFFIFSSSYM